MRSIPSIQSFPHKNSHFLVYTQLHTRILFCPCVQLSLCSLCCQIQSTPSILSATNSTVWYLHTVSVNHYNLLHTHILFYSCVLFPLFSLFHTKTVSFLFTHSYTHAFCSAHALTFALHSILSNTVDSIYIVSYKLYSLELHTVSFNHYNLLHTHILFYSCVLFPLFSLFHTKTVSFLFTLSYTHAFCSAHAFNFRFAVYAVKYSRLHLYCQLQTVQSDTYIQSVSIITTCFTHTFCSTHGFYSLYSVFSTQKQSVSCFTQLHTRILFCPCVNFRFAFHSVKYSRLHLYCQLQTVQSGTYIQSVSIITTCYTQLFCSTHAFYSIYIVLFLINSYLLVCTLL